MYQKKPFKKSKYKKQTKIIFWVPKPKYPYFISIKKVI